MERGEARLEKVEAKIRRLMDRVDRLEYENKHRGRNTGVSDEVPEYRVSTGIQIPSNEALEG